MLCDLTRFSRAVVADLRSACLSCKSSCVKRRYCSDICKKFNISTDTAVNYVSLYLTKAEEMAMARTDMDNFQVHKYEP